MSRTKSVCWPIGVLETGLLTDQALGDDFIVEPQAPLAVQTITLLDDFDWHLWQASRLLVQQGQHYRLLSPEDREGSLEITQAGSPVFSWQFTSSAFADALAGYIGLRALQPVASGQLSSAVWNVREAQDRKIVCRIRLLHFSSEPRARGYWQLSPLRGYLDVFNLVGKRLEGLLGEGLADVPVDLHFLLSDLELDDAMPRGESINLRASMASKDAVSALLLNLVQDAQRHLPGMLDDVDTEFLHDFRVQLRKARSLVQLMKNALPPEQQLALKTLLADAMRPTGNVRDLDVFLLEQERYRSLLPDMHQPGFEQLIRNIKSARAQAFNALCDYLASDSYRQTLQRLLDVAAAPDFAPTTTGQASIGAVVDNLISKRYRKICKLGLLIDDDTPDEEVHNLRIECKKLRYLLTLFGELCAPKPLKKMIKRMKSLQTVLGDFNDCGVQQEFLAAQAARSRSQPLQIAVSGLVAVLYQKQRTLRSQVCGSMAAFAAADTADLVESLFKEELESCEQ